MVALKHECCRQIRQYCLPSPGKFQISFALIPYCEEDSSHTTIFWIAGVSEEERGEEEDVGRGEVRLGGGGAHPDPRLIQDQERQCWQKVFSMHMVHECDFIPY